MPITSYPHNFLLGLSDFWQRFFADAGQLKFMYDGSAVLMGQAYLDMLENVLGLSLQDVPVFHREYFYLLTVREDQVRFERGAAVDDDRWLVALSDGLVNFKTLDNKVLEPTASLQEHSDYDLSSTDIRFRQDPTDPAQDGTPLPGYARRALDVEVGGFFDDTTRPTGTSWMSRNVRKGDTLRLLDIGPDPMNPQQRKRSDHAVVLVREKGFYVSPDDPLTASATAQNYVVLRRPYADEVELEDLVFSPPSGLPAVADLAHTRLDQGSVRVFGRRGYDGQDVVEGVDYTIDYELGKVYKLNNTTVNPGSLDWLAAVAPKISYTWQQEVWPLVGGSPPRFAQTGVVRSTTGTARVLQIALWALDAAVDKKTLANNFGALIGSNEASSEAYRALLRGIYQLYILGPVLERIESALNVILGFPVIRDDGETIVKVDQSLPDVTRVTTLRPSTNTEAVYDYPKDTPIRPDVIGATPGSLTFAAFEPLTVALTVTDYLEDPTWWHNTVIPEELFSTVDGAVVPEPARRTASPSLVKHVCGAEDKPKCGDPGLICGADEEGNIPPPGNPVYRRRLAFILMDRFLKHHTFAVKFNPAVLSGTSVGTKFARTLDELNDLVRQSKPAHTYVFVTPSTQFNDTLQIAEERFYQPQRYLGANPDAPELYLDSSQVPNPLAPFTELGIFLKTGMSSPPGGADKILFDDGPPVVGAGVWRAGDYYHYELQNDAQSFPTIGLPVTLNFAPTSPRRGRLVLVHVGGTKGGKRLVENIDYTVDYGGRSITRLTVWDASFAIPVTFVQLNIGNTADAPADVADGDTALATGGLDPGTVRASYDPAAIDWSGAVIPVSDHRDLSMVEHPVTPLLTPVWAINNMPIDQGIVAWGFSATDIYVGGSFGSAAKWNGSTWTDVSPGPATVSAIFGIWGFTNAAIWAVGPNNKVVKTTDQGSTWTNQTPPGADNYLYALWGTSATDFWIGGDTGNIYHTTNGGASWTPYLISTGSPGASVFTVYGPTANHVYAAVFGGVAHWNGSTWSFTALDPLDATYQVWALGSEAWAVTALGHIYYSNNDGLTWTPDVVDAPSGTYLYSIWGNGSGQMFAVGTDGSDGVAYIRMGRVWRKLPVAQNGPGDFLNNLWVDSTTGKGVLVGGFNGYALKW